jgi:hypothetical protein
MRRILLLALFSVAVLVLLSVALGCNTSGRTPPSDQSAGRESASQTENDQLTVYITETGERYHLSSCRTLRGGGRPISLGEAKRRGYKACKVCQPPR